MDSRCCRSTVPQLEFLIQCMERFPELAMGKSTEKSRYEPLHAIRKWNQITNALNKIEPKAARTRMKWMKYWTDQKHQARRLQMQAQQKSLQTGEPRKPLSQYRKRILKIIRSHEKGQGDQKYKNDPMDEVEMVATEQLNEVKMVPTEQLDEVNMVPTEQLDEVNMVPTEQLDEVKMDSRRFRSTAAQMEFLIQCMERFPELAMATAKSKYEQLHAIRKWNQIINALNKIEPKAARSRTKWLKYWTDQKHQARRLLMQAQQRSLQTGEPRKPLSPYHERILKILRSHGKGQDDQKYKKYPMDEVVPTEKMYEVKMVPTEKMYEVKMVPTEKMYEVKMVPTEQLDEVETVPTEQLDVISDTDIPKEEVEVSELEAALVALSPSPNPEEVLQENPIDIDNKVGKLSIEDLQVEILKFNLQRQKEMHDLEMSCLMERHKLELEILELKKKTALQELQKTNDNNDKKISYKILPKYFIKQ